VNRLTPIEVLAIHDRVLQRTGGTHGVRDLGALVSTLSRPFGGTASGDFYPTLEHKAAALCHGLVREHPFADGNHRTGVAAAAMLMERNGRRLVAEPAEIVQFARGVAGEHHRIEEMADWFKDHSEPLARAKTRSRTRIRGAKEQTHA
jgi:death on curing protein